ncbi:MAG TPA: NAD(P)H-dependent oxidoreductase [Chitinophagaceae bacterium]|nr:NAD(P)H-dependent oxidoreductase [Chitinophagaceae bacterium]
MLKNKIKILAVSGSLRANSSNAIILLAIEKMLPEDVAFFIYKGLGGLPHFDDAEEIPIAVSVWRKHLQEADAVVICSPEYAFGVPGSLKNALDWTVGSGELVNKPLALITASTGGEKAHAALLHIFTALSAKIPEGASLLISFVRSKLNAAGEISDAPTLAAVKTVLEKLIQFAQEEA